MHTYKVKLAVTTHNPNRTLDPAGYTQIHDGIPIVAGSRDGEMGAVEMAHLLYDSQEETQSIRVIAVSNALPYIGDIPSSQKLAQTWFELHSAFDTLLEIAQKEI